MSAVQDAGLKAAPDGAQVLVRLLRFAIETHPPLIYALISLGWSYSVMGTLLAGSAAQTPSGIPVMALVFFLVLLYLRALDEIKDLPYDRLHHPERPLVRGAVQVPEVAAFAIAVAAGVLALCASLSVTVALFAAGQMLYGLGLLLLERRWRRFRESVLLNLIITFPVSAALNGLVALHLHAQGLPVQHLAAVLLMHVAFFLHMEFGRKLVWPQHRTLGEHSYAEPLGVAGALAVCALLGLVGAAAAAWLLAPAGAWAALPALALLLSCIGFVRFARGRQAGEAPAMKPWFGGAMILFFALSAGVGFAAR
jgi:4-hydroxybenzoate polyprenyltransferase